MPVKRLALLVAACLVALAAPAASAAPVTRTAAIGSFFYKPAYLRVNPGDTVTWRNGASILHTVTSTAGAPERFDSDTLDSGATFSRTFTKPGRYTYLCTLHPSLMRGVVQVGADTVKPTVSKLSARSSAHKLRLRLKLSEDARVSFTVKRGRKRVASFRTKVEREGGLGYAYTFGGSRALEPGRYTVSAVATDAAGNRGRATRAAFRVR